MTTYGISRLHVGEAVSWLVIATLPDGSHLISSTPSAATGLPCGGPQEVQYRFLHEIM
jgi:hypothetical protein